ncbi:hypothetical protein M9H77_22959 [Catharanthus roseus]|uniref:Uncharacterized protein n=1 Tax=Catharanthus roseus TaxID=4058 RepID=A0ACC0ASM2_CATRO|nr:hypothetical protein M9H77_22959 [Catharanthus roseus]
MKKKIAFRPGCQLWLRCCVRKRQRIALYVASPPYEGLFRWRGQFRLGRVDPLEEGYRPRRMWPNRSTWTPHHALRWDSTTYCARNPHISSGRSGAHQTTEVLGQEFLGQISQSGMAHPSLRWTYREGTLVDEPNRTTSSSLSSSSYSLREIVPEREPIPVIDLSDDESREGPEINMSGSQSPNHADEAVSEISQNRQFEPIREATPHPEQATHKVIENFMIKMTELLGTSMATRRNERVPATGADEALGRFLKFRPPEFYGEVEQEIKAELFLEQLNDIYDTLKYEDGLKVIFAAFRL